MQIVRDMQVSGAPDIRPHVVGQQVEGGAWQLLLMVPHAGSEFDGNMVMRTLSPDDAEALARDLMEYAALIREKQAPASSSAAVGREKLASS